MSIGTEVTLLQDCVTAVVIFTNSNSYSYMLPSRVCGSIDGEAVAAVKDLSVIRRNKPAFSADRARRALCVVCSLVLYDGSYE